jgi:hypothetical protein
MFNFSPSASNTSNASFNMSSIEKVPYKRAGFVIERNHTTNTYNAFIDKKKTHAVPDKLFLTDITGIANQFSEFKINKTTPPTNTKMLSDDLNTRFFVASITVLGLFMFYKLSMDR